MTSKSTKKDWRISAVDYGRSLKGFGVNLLVAEIKPAIKFAQDILQASVVYWNEDFAVVMYEETQWMLHADHSYSDNSYLGVVQGQDARGTGVELRLYNLDPDRAEQRARDQGHIVLNGAMNKPHGLRECYLIDPDGYCWVPSRALTDEEAAAFR